MLLTERITMSTDQTGPILTPQSPDPVAPQPIPQNLPPAGAFGTPPAPPAPSVAPQPFAPQGQPYGAQMPQPQPGYGQPAWQGQPQYVPMVPKQPSPLTDAKAFANKLLPIAALVTVCGYGLYGIWQLINGITYSTGTYGGGGQMVGSGIFALIFYCAQGVLWACVLLGIKHLISLSLDMTEAEPAA